MTIHTRTIDFLDGRGHLSLTWEPFTAESVERAQRDFEALRQAGYSFFRVTTREPVDAFEASAGALEVVRVDAAEVAPRLESPPAAASKRGSRRQRRAESADRPERVVAARPMRGG